MCGQIEANALTMQPAWHLLHLSSAKVYSHLEVHSPADFA